jgi:hypothetical protein
MFCLKKGWVADEIDESTEVDHAGELGVGGGVRRSFGHR